ncbi:MAG: hypothetical protein UZ16_OP3001002484 [Candidatus Hinthialibacteria bacterium OLB16]|nr:MAG: hypothetical protein UZ16_OP3001002484 [Candidatus Hinthialibacteria bacterium OLB16]
MSGCTPEGFWRNPSAGALVDPSHSALAGGHIGIHPFIRWPGWNPGVHHHRIVLLQYFYVLPFEEGYARALCFCTIPPLLGLLPWRLYPCRIELRGIGAFLPGFMIGAITLVGREKAFTTKAVVLPGIVFIAVFSLFCLWLLEQHLFLPSRKKIDSETGSRKIIIKN